MNFINDDISLARELDAHDELRAFRDEFLIDDPNLIYLDGNSLGRLPKRTIDYMRQAIESAWGERLIRIWNDGWINTPTELGAKIARLVGAQPNEILVTEATSINLFKLALAALHANPDRDRYHADRREVAGFQGTVAQAGHALHDHRHDHYLFGRLVCGDLRVGSHDHLRRVSPGDVSRPVFRDLLLAEFNSYRA